MGLFSEGGVNEGALLGGILKNRAATMGQISNIGAQGSADINQQFDAAQKAAQSKLAASGMNNSTISPSIGALYNSEKSSALSRLMDSLSTQRAGTMEKYGQMQAEAQAVPQAPGMGWGILGNLIGAGSALGGAFLKGGA